MVVKEKHFPIQLPKPSKLGGIAPFQYNKARSKGTI